MNEEVERVEEEEVLQADAQETESGDEHDDDSSKASDEQQSKRNDADYNWSEMRRQMREKDQQIEELRNQFSSLANRAPTAQEQDELEQLAEDDILTVAQAKKLATKMARQVATEALKARDASTAEERAALKYPDFAQVVSQENIDKLKREKPRLFNTLAAYKEDPYEQALAAYEMIKEKVYTPPPDSFEKKKAKENSSKPLSVQAMKSTSPIADVNQFAQMDSSSKKAFLQKIYQEMQESIKAG